MPYGPMRVIIEVYIRRKAHCVPDVDNLAKAVLDACNGLLWADDGQVVELVVRQHDCRVTSSEERCELQVEQDEEWA